MAQKQVTSANGKRSTNREIRWGIPQGSILAPLFFLIYVYGIRHRGSTDILFVDDTSYFLLWNAFHYGKTSVSTRHLWEILSKLPMLKRSSVKTTLADISQAANAKEFLSKYITGSYLLSCQCNRGLYKDITGRYLDIWITGRSQVSLAAGADRIPGGGDKPHYLYL